jgi:predicted phage tail protein
MYSVNLNFKNKASYNKFKRNMNKGKGTNLKASDIEGEGIFDGLKKVANSKITKGIVKGLTPAIAKTVQGVSGSNFAGDVTQAGLNAYTGSSVLDILKKVGNSNITKGVAKALAPAIADQVKQQTGSNLAGDIANAGLKSYAGSGVGNVAQSGVLLPANTLPSSDINDDIKATMRKKMAMVRSHRKKKVVGGAINPLGSR